MTEKCIKTLKELRTTNKTFANLSVEQLLFEAINAVGIKEVKTVLEVTDWKKIVIEHHSLSKPPMDAAGIIKKYAPNSLLDGSVRPNQEEANEPM